MPIPATKISISSALASGLAFRILPDTAGDFSSVLTGTSVPAWVTAIADLNADGVAEMVIGAASDDDKALDAGRIFVRSGQSTGGTSGTLGGVTDMIIDGVFAGDLAGSSVSSIGDLNGDGKAEILIGAPGMDNGALIDAGVAFVVWGAAPGTGVDLQDLYDGAGSGKGFAIKGVAAGDLAGTSITSIADLNGDGKGEILIGAPNAAGGDGAVYVVHGKSSDAPVNLSSIAAGVGGYRIVGEEGSAGRALGTVTDMNGDGRAEILVGAPDFNLAGGLNNGAAYVVFGQAGTTAVDLANVAAGVGGFRIVGNADEDAGSSVAGLGDINGDGIADIVVGAQRSSTAYVVFGKNTGTEVDLADVAAGIGGYRIVAEAPGDLDAVTLAVGADFNRDGINDIVIGAANNREGGEDAGAVYVVWGGGSGTVNLSQVAQGIGGAKVVGSAGSMLGSSVAIAPDMNGDTTADLIIGAPGTTEAVYTLFTPAAWQPDNNVYGTEGDDVIGPGYGAMHPVGETADTIIALGGNDVIDAAGGHDSIEGGAGNDTLNAGSGDDLLDGGTGIDAMNGGLGNDTYLVDNLLDTTSEAGGDGVDTVKSSVNWTLAADFENLELTGSALNATGNGGSNTLTGNALANVLNGGAGADTMIGGNGGDTYHVDQIGDTILETGTGGTDTVVATVDWTLGENLESLQLAGAARMGNGNAGNNALTGTSGNDTLDGKAGADTMTGLAGDDQYFVDNVGDNVVEALNGGTDTVTASVNHTLAGNVENLILTGAARIGTGNALSNSLTGTIGDDTLDGGTGIDTMNGGAGNDTYRVDVAADVIVEAAGGGTDTVVAAFDYVLSAELENLQLTGVAHVGTGNGGANTITGGTGDDVLDGAGGADLLIGGLGNDTYKVDDAGDVVQEGLAGGTDTIVATTNYTMAANAEILRMEGVGLTGTGSDGNDTLVGTAGQQTLIGGLGNDTLDGGAGGDAMTGGDGDDTYYVDDINDLVTETATGGIDTVVTAFAGTIAEHIENIRLTGTAHAATGNSGNNTLSGNSGDDTLDGAGGDDLLLGGDGDDTLHSHSGSDTLSGGSGDDRYKVGGGNSTHIEDFLGHDTLDVSDASEDCYVDLSGETQSHVGSQTCDFGVGGTTAAPLDVQFLQDLSGSFGDDIANVRLLVPQIVTALRGVQTNSVFGSSSFIDKAINPFGAPGEWTYRTELALTSDQTLLAATYNNLVIRFGNDEPEAQIEGLMQLALHSPEVGFRPDSARFVVLFTDAPFHNAGDGAAAGITTPNNGDAIMDGGGIGEDYPLVAQVRSALEAANIIPVFAIAGGYEAVYGSLVTQLGRGTVVTLSADSSNVVAAITNGLTAATTTHIEDCYGGSGNDNIKGDVKDNYLLGNGGHDSLYGGSGNDRLEGADGNDHMHGGSGNDEVHGGVGDDTVELTGAWLNYDISVDATGVMTIVDRRAAGDGTDHADGVEHFQFSNGTFAASVVLNTGPVAGDDTVNGLTEASATTAGVPQVLGSVLGNDSDANLATVGLGETLSISGVRTGAPIDVGAITAVGASTVINGTYGSLTIRADGTYQYDLDDARAATDALTTGMTVEDVFTYELADAHGATALARLAFAIAGADESGVHVNTPPTGAPVISDLTPTEGDVLAADPASLADVDGLGPLAYQWESLVAGNWTAIAGATNASFTATQAEVNAALRVVVSYTDLAGTAESVASAATAGVGDLITGTAVVDSLVGTNFDDRLIGLAGNDSLNGGAGSDIMEGGLGNDTYTVAESGDQVMELTAQGTDTVRTTLASYVLTDFVENLTYTGTGTFDGTGNASGNVLTGGANADVLRGMAGNDTLSGGLGADALFGGAGNDTYTVGSGDVVTELTGEGTDTVSTSLAAYTLTDFVEHLTFTSTTGSTGTGNALSNTLTGGSGADRLYGLDGNDTLSGGAGADFLYGGIGNDTYTVGVGDAVIEIDGEGTDTVRTALASYTLGAFLENLTFTGTTTGFTGIGNDLNNALTGGSRADVLEGGIGDDTLNGLADADIMRGGMGNDTYNVDNLADVVDESTGSGIDTIRTTLANFTLANDIENLTYAGTGVFTGTGNAGANILTAGTGNQTLDGGAGADSLRGGTGNDTYIVDNVGDVITESASAGTDVVLSSVTHTLGANVEQLALTGAAAIDGTGNTSANVLTGNDADNVLSGLSGNDTISAGDGIDRISGGSGNDSLTGGLGADHFRFDTTLSSTTNVDTIIDFVPGADVIELENAIFTRLVTTGALTAANFNASLTGTAADANDYILYDTDSGALLYDSDGTGLAAAVRFANLIGNPAVTAADFSIT